MLKQLLSGIILSVLAGFCAGTDLIENKPSRTTLPVPLSSGEKSPAKTNAASSTKALLLLDDEETTADSGKPVADNSRCHVCHMNFSMEDLSVKHAKANVGCAKCHGESDEHIADESWASGGNGTAPEIMYPRSKIAVGCISCHKPEQVFLKIEKHKPDIWAIAYDDKSCTECHGKHRMAIRKCKWK